MDSKKRHAVRELTNANQAVASAYRLGALASSADTGAK
jgi:hypothetical protein